jgi:hypothetical protein
LEKPQVKIMFPLTEGEPIISFALKMLELNRCLSPQEKWQLFSHDQDAPFSRNHRKLILEWTTLTLRNDEIKFLRSFFSRAELLQNFGNVIPFEDLTISSLRK